MIMSAIRIPGILLCLLLKRVDSTPRIITFVSLPKTGANAMALLVKSELGLRHPGTKYFDFCASVTATTSPRAPGDPPAFCATDLETALRTWINYPDATSTNAYACYFMPTCGLSLTPQLQNLRRPGMLSFTMLRDPVSRQLSAYFAGAPHSQRTCSLDLPQTPPQCANASRLHSGEKVVASVNRVSSPCKIFS